MLLYVVPIGVLHSCNVPNIYIVLYAILECILDIYKPNNIIYLK